MTQPSYDLLNYRFFDDDGTGESDQSALGTGNNQLLDRQTGTTNRFCVRIELYNDNGKSGVETWNWEYSYDSGAWTTISTTSNVIRCYDSSLLTDGGSCTQRLSSSTPFLAANEGVDETGAIESVSVGAGDYLENLLSCYIVDADVADGKTIDIRVTEGSGDTITYTNTPALTVDKAAAPVNVNLNAATITANGKATTLTKGAVSTELSAAAITASGQIVDIALVTIINLNAASITANGKATTLTLGAISTELNAAALTALGKTATIDAPIAIDLNAANIIANGPQVTVGSITTIDLAAAAITANGQPSSIVPGAISTELSSATLAATGQNTSVTPGSIDIALDTARTFVSDTHMVFNGSTSDVDCGSDASLDDIPDGAEFTAEFWVNWTGGEDDYPGFIAKIPNSDTGWFVYGRVSTDRIGFQLDCTTTDVSSYKESSGVLNTGWHHIAVYYDDTGDRKGYIAIDGVWFSSYTVQTAGVDAYVSDANHNLRIGRSRTTRNVEASMGWTRISDNDRYSHGTNFTPPPRQLPPSSDINTIEQWNALDGSGTTLSAEENSPTNDGNMTDVDWSVNQPVNITPGAIATSLDTALLTAIGKAVEVSLVTEINLSTANITANGKQIGIDRDEVISLSAANITASGQQAAITTGAIAIGLAAANISTSGKATDVIEGEATILLSTALLTANGKAVVVSGAGEITLATAVITASGQQLTPAPGAISTELGLATLATNEKAADIIAGEAIIDLDTGLITANEKAATPIPGPVSINLGIATISTSGQAATIVTGEVTIQLSAATLTANGKVVEVLLAGTITLKTANITAFAPQATLDVPTDINLSTATITAFANTLGVPQPNIVLLVVLAAMSLGYTVQAPSTIEFEVER